MYFAKEWVLQFAVEQDKDKWIRGQKWIAFFFMTYWLWWFIKGWVEEKKVLENFNEISVESNLLLVTSVEK